MKNFKWAQQVLIISIIIIVIVIIIIIINIYLIFIYIADAYQNNYSRSLLGIV